MEKDLEMLKKFCEKQDLRFATFMHIHLSDGKLSASDMNKLIVVDAPKTLSYKHFLITAPNAFMIEDSIVETHDIKPFNWYKIIERCKRDRKDAECYDVKDDIAELCKKVKSVMSLLDNLSRDKVFKKAFFASRRRAFVKFKGMYFFVKDLWDVIKAADYFKCDKLYVEKSVENKIYLEKEEDRQVDIVLSETPVNKHSYYDLDEDKIVLNILGERKEYKTFSDNFDLHSVFDF